MLYVAKMYTEKQWAFDTPDDVVSFLGTDEVHHNDAMVVDVHEDGVRAWIGTDFLQHFEDIAELA